MACVGFHPQLLTVRGIAMGSAGAWSRYVLALGKKGKPDPGLARFNARFNLATSFEGVSLAGVSDRTVQAYSSGIRVALAYSALEALDSALGKRIARTRMSDENLARRYRSQTCDGLRELLEESTQASQVQHQLQILASDKDADDVMPVAASVRHLVFHGDFTAHGSGAAQSAGVRKFLDDLANALILRADDQFELYLDREAIGPWDVRRRSQCPSCGVSIGQMHGRLCDIALCKTHGHQRSTCFEEGRHQMTKYWGVFPGTMEAFKNGWVIRHEGRDVPDINTVISELEWDPVNERFY